MALLICSTEKYSVRVSESRVILKVFYKSVDRDALDVVESETSPHLWIFFKTNNMKLRSFKKYQNLTRRLHNDYEQHFKSTVGDCNEN